MPVSRTTAELQIDGILALYTDLRGRTRRHVAARIVDTIYGVDAGDAAGYVPPARQD